MVMDWTIGLWITLGLFLGYVSHKLREVKYLEKKIKLRERENRFMELSLEDRNIKIQHLEEKLSKAESELREMRIALKNRDYKGEHD